MAKGRGRAAWRMEVAGRIVAATFGAYALAWCYTAFAALLLIRLGLAKSDAVAWATLSAFVVLVLVALAAFALRSLARFAAGLVAAIALFALGAALLGRH